MESITNKEVETIGSRIDKLIHEKGIQKKVFAVDMEVSIQTVSNWISNSYKPSFEKLKEIAQYFGVDIDYLTCKNPYKNIDDMLSAKADKTAIEMSALQNMLLSRGYYKGNVKAFKYETYKKKSIVVPYELEQAIECDGIYDISDNSAIYERISLNR